MDLFFLLTRLGLGTNRADGYFFDFSSLNELLSDNQWEEIYQLGVKQGVAAIQFAGLQQLYKKSDLPPSLSLPSPRQKMQWFAHTMQVENHCTSQFKVASELAEIYAEHGIRTVVLKGIAAGVNYPQPNLRPCGDLDCFLVGDFEKGNAIAEQNGAKVDPFHYKHSHIFYKGLMVENHRFCTGIRGSKRTKAFERLLQSILKEKETTRIEDTALECPSPIFNALFWAHHAQRHFLTEGIALRHLCDWAMLIHKHGAKIDWVRFKNCCEEYGMSQFADSMTRLSEKLLHVKVPSSYIIGKDEERDSYMLQEFMNGISSNSPSHSEWQSRLNMIKSIYSSRKRHKMFSDMSFLENISRLAYGFCFDRNPHL